MKRRHCQGPIAGHREADGKSRSGGQGVSCHAAGGACGRDRMLEDAMAAALESAAGSGPAPFDGADDPWDQTLGLTSGPARGEDALKLPGDPEAAGAGEQESAIGPGSPSWRAWDAVKQRLLDEQEEEAG